MRLYFQSILNWGNVDFCHVSLFLGSDSYASRPFIFFKFDISDKKSKDFDILYEVKFPNLKKWFKKRKSFVGEKKQNVSDPESC